MYFMSKKITNVIFLNKYTGGKLTAEQLLERLWCKKTAKSLLEMALKNYSLRRINGNHNRKSMSVIRDNSIIGRNEKKQSSQK